jgi:hypothetical protein
MNTIKSLIACALPVLFANFAIADSVTLQSSAGDLRVSALRAAPDAPLANTNRDAVSFSAAVNQSQRVEKQDPFVAVSREYRVSVTAQQLRQGIAVRTTAPGAVVALSPLSVVKGAGLSPLDVSIITSDGSVLRGSDGMDQLVDQAAIQATGVPFSNGMVGFRLNRALGSGDFILQTDKGAPAPRYQLHVLDAQGGAELSLQAPEQALAGQAFNASGRFDTPAAQVLKSATAFVLSPGGERLDASVSLKDDAYTVTAVASGASSYDQGLWEMHVSAFDATGLQRDVKTAFAAVYPTARFGGVIQRSGFDFNIGVEVVSAGRYEASAILYGTTRSGLVPVASSATAQWLERGAGVVRLSFDSKVVDAAGVTAPFALKRVTLKDQSRMSVLERVSATTEFE